MLLPGETLGEESFLAVRNDTLLSFDLQGELAESFELKHEDLKATNTRDRPDAVSPVRHPACELAGAGLKATLKPLSWNVFALRAKGSVGAS